MRVMITGVNGQLGHDIKKELLRLEINDIVDPLRDELDITDEGMVREIILSQRPDIIIHCAAYTAVDRAEDEKDLCYDVNVAATRYIVKYAKEVGARIIYISTDYVFDGDKVGCYVEDDEVCPINYYGETKLMGEDEVLEYDDFLIARISWVFGSHGNNFVKTMLRLALEKSEISVVDDQVGSPTYTVDAARVIVNMALSNLVGIYHVTNDGYCSWNEFARYIFKKSHKKVKVLDIKTKDYKTKAKRPLNSRLSHEKMVRDGFSSLPSWQDAVDRFLIELESEEIK